MMMHLIVGLGNPGENYDKSRHNVGFMYVDYVAKLFNTPFSDNKKFNAQLAKWKNTILIKPQTFMNNSGQSVTALVKFYGVGVKNIIVIHDDLDIPLGQYKIQFGKGPKLHGGISSIEESIRDNNFWRVRIGVDSRDPDNREAGEKFVLETFNDSELKTITQVISSSWQEVGKRLEGTIK